MFASLYIILPSPAVILLTGFTRPHIVSCVLYLMLFSLMCVLLAFIFIHNVLSVYVSKYVVYFLGGVVLEWKTTENWFPFSHLL